MDWFTRAFIQSSLVWLALGVTVGVGMAVHPAWTIYKPVHMHMTLLGFVTMMIYGVGYHVLPRFAGSALWSKRFAAVHVALSNAGLALMCAGFTVRVWTSFDQHVATAILGAGGTLSAIGAYLFVFNMWRTIGTAAERRARIERLEKLTALSGRVRVTSA